MPGAPFPEYVGVDRVAALFDVPPNTVYSWSARGQLGRPDLCLSNKALWLRDRFKPNRLAETIEEQVDRGARPPPPIVLAGPDEVAAMFRRKRRTLEQWRWRARDLPASDPNRPPEPAFRAAVTPIWVAADWRPWAEHTRRHIVVPSLAQWRREQKALIEKLASRSAS